MESKHLSYVNGHFYERGTQNRVELKDGAEICIVATSDSFIAVTTVGKSDLKLLNAESKKFKLENDPEINKFKKIYDSGAILYFQITRFRIAGNKFAGTIKHEFAVELLEDLYLYTKINWKTQEAKLYDCVCLLKENTSNTIPLFEEVKAKSLNEVYKSTFVHYFGNKGNPACNALDRFYDIQGKKENVISRHR